MEAWGYTIAAYVVTGLLFSGYLGVLLLTRRRLRDRGR